MDGWMKGELCEQLDRQRGRGSEREKETEREGQRDRKRGTEGERNNVPK